MSARLSFCAASVTAIYESEYPQIYLLVLILKLLHIPFTLSRLQSVFQSSVFSCLFLLHSADGLHFFKLLPLVLQLFAES